MFWDYIVGLLSGVTLTGLAWIATRLIRAHGRRARRRFTGEFFGATNEKPILIVHAATYDEKRRAWDWPAPDAKAATLITGILIDMGMNLGVHFQIMPHSDAMVAKDVVDPNVKDANLVLVGGPKRNPLTKAVLSLLTTMRYSIRDDTKPAGTYCVHDSFGDKNYYATDDDVRPTANTALPEGDDWGIVLSTRSPFRSDRTLVVLAGLHGAGTLGAAQVLREQSRLAQLWQSREPGDTLQKLVKVHYVDREKGREIVSFEVR